MSCYDTVATTCIFLPSLRPVCTQSHCSYSHLPHAIHGASVRRAATRLLDYHSSETSDGSVCVRATRHGAESFAASPLSYFAGGSAEDCAARRSATFHLGLSAGGSAEDSTAGAQVFK